MAPPRRALPHNASVPEPHPPLRWDIFCQVIDNHGDLGVCWRLATALAARAQQVRLWVDDARALDWMAPAATRPTGVQVLPWTRPLDPMRLAGLPPADVWVEAFGCQIATEFIAAGAERISAANHKGLKPPVWINLEYLSAEGYVERMHGLPSPVLQGPARGWTKWFFYPGFTPATGGLLREDDLPARQAAFDRRAWLAGQGIDWQGERLISLFCYEPPALATWIAQLRGSPEPTRLLVTAGRARQAVEQVLEQENRLQRPSSQRQQLSISYLPRFTQIAYDELLWACDLNFVRGEDSLVRALWAGQPLVWHIYPQPEDNAHHAKLRAFLDWLEAPASLRQFHLAWNGIDGGTLPAPDLPAWRRGVQAARQRLHAQTDLATQLLRFVARQTL